MSVTVYVVSHYDHRLHCRDCRHPRQDSTWLTPAEAHGRAVEITVRPDDRTDVVGWALQPANPERPHDVEWRLRAGVSVTVQEVHVLGETSIPSLLQRVEALEAVLDVATVVRPTTTVTVGAADD